MTVLTCGACRSSAGRPPCMRADRRRCRARAGADRAMEGAVGQAQHTEREVAKESASRSASVSTQCCEGDVEHVRAPLDQVEAFQAVAEEVRFGHRRHHVQPWNDGSKARERRRRRRSGRVAREGGETRCGAAGLRPWAPTALAQPRRGAGPCGGARAWGKYAAFSTEKEMNHYAPAVF